MEQGFEKLGLEPVRYDLTPTIQPDRVLLESDSTFANIQNGPLILHINPPEVPAAMITFGLQKLRNRPLIGYWAWELPELPALWQRIADYFDEIWTPSDFVTEALKSNIARPVRTVGYFIDPGCVDLEMCQSWREQLQLDETFSVFFACDPRSSLARKNPKGVIQAFQKAFPNNASARLILKLLGSDHHDITAIWDSTLQAQTDDRIKIINEQLDDDQMKALVGACDVVMSLHRSEGYGLLPAEANAIGKPVIVTGWSGSRMYLDSPGMFPVDYQLVRINDISGIYHHKTAKWAEPDVAHAASYLRQIFEMSTAERSELEARSKLWWQEHAGIELFRKRVTQSPYL